MRKQVVVSAGLLSAVVLLHLLLAGCAMGNKTNSGEQVKMTADNGWKLVWNDEFDGGEIDRSKWDYDIGGHGFGNNESQYYTTEKRNAYIEDGKLVIQAIEEEYGGKPYSSAKLITRGKADWTYGRFEFRAKLPEGQGIWPAIWMMPTDMQKYGGWPTCGEIDIMEMVGHEPNKVYGTLHMGNPHYYFGGNYTLKEGKFSDDFHVFALDWTPEEMRWYIDGEMYYSTSDWYTRKNESSEKEPFPAPFDRAFYLQLNLAVGGNWPGYPNDSTVFPQTFELDYVRVYQPEDGDYTKK
ncbi:glycoside hydrolase family 16 protein [Paenibacillus thermotolerans]|uniref:glycoside hydrolase family 16 protein n=1 Tax=Paenibacillus thermotolerans TaxID=3027807 RepID=UPI002368B69C|nr:MULTISPECIES: glycoside hydrolase family 16 protein [unclassified Paenibacillus]